MIPEKTEAPVARSLVGSSNGFHPSSIMRVTEESGFVKLREKPKAMAPPVMENHGSHGICGGGSRTRILHLTDGCPTVRRPRRSILKYGRSRKKFPRGALSR